MKKHTTNMTFFQTLMHGVKCIKSISLGTKDENGENKNTLETLLFSKSSVFLKRKQKPDVDA